MQVVVNGLLTNYVTAGKGRTVLLLHGWGDSSATFRTLIKDLEPKYRLLALDLPGFGNTQVPPVAWNLDDYVEFIVMWLKKIEVDNVYALIGHSFGGSVAIVGMASGSFKAQKLVLLASSGVRGQRSIKLKILWAVTKILKVPLYLLPARKMEKIKIFFYRKAGSDMLLLPHMRQTFARIIKQDVREDAGKIVSPTLLIYGAKDKETPVSYGEILHSRIKDSKLEITKDAGHFLHHDKPEEISTLVMEFLK